MKTVQKKKPGLPARLTPMQMKFAELLVYFEGRKYAYECALEAGYSGGKSESENTLGARVEASRLQNPKLFPHVVKYIGELKEERNKKYGVNYGGHLTELGKIRDQALKDRSYSAATVAEKAQDDPHCPWLVIGVTAPFVLQSTTSLVTLLSCEGFSYLNSMDPIGGTKFK